jgi:signal transduction histidine kinase
MDAIRREVGAMIAHERRQLALRSSLSQRQERNAEQIVVASLVGTLALTLGVGLMLLFQIRRRLKAEQRARRAARLVQETLDNAGIGVAVADRDGRIVARNADLVRMLPELADSDAPALLETERAAARDRRPFLVERKLGRTSAVLRGVLLSDDRYLITVADVTEARRAEQAKSEFVATVSHELRTPVTSIRGALGMLAGPLASGLPDKHKSLVELALRNADRLTLLINDILDVEKIESGSMTFALEPCDANKLVRDAAEMNRAYADARGVTLALGALARPLLVLADPHRIQQVLANLISNAVKFSDAGGLVQVTAVPGSGGAVISVHDRGPGIPPEFRDRIFERFAQADATDARTKGGTGLGLSISKAIVEKHGGRLRFESQPGSTTFSFELPLHSTDAQVYDGESVPCSTHEVACP